MNFNINESLAEIVKALKGQLGDDWQDAKGEITSMLDMKKQRLDLLATMRLQNKITDADFKSFLEDEKNTTAMELHTVAVISKVTAENAANTIIKVFETLVTKAISAAT